MLWPDHKTTFLGKLLDAAKLWVGVPQEELQAFAQQVEELQSGTTVTPPPPGKSGRQAVLPPCRNSSATVCAYPICLCERHGMG
jgi:hypothetical protein